MGRRYGCLRCRIELSEELAPNGLCPNDKEKLVVISSNEGLKIGSDIMLTAPLHQSKRCFVFAGKDRCTNQRVVVKMLDVVDPYEISLLDKEAATLERLKHPGIVSLVGRGWHEESRPFLVLNLIDGLSLAQMLEREAWLNAETAVPMFAQLCDTVKYLVEKKVTPQLRPGHILLGEAGNRTVIIDPEKLNYLGHPKWENRTMDEPVTKPFYDSPEELKGPEEVFSKEQSMVWTLGAILYEALVGRPPFDDDKILVVCKSIFYDDPVQPSVLNKAVPKAVNDLVMSCLQKSPAQRPQGLVELKKALLATLAVV